MKKFLLIILTSFTLSAMAQPTKNGVAAVFGQKEKFVKFYPNPAVSVISFEFQKTIERGYTLQIFNFLGKKVFGCCFRFSMNALEKKWKFSKIASY